MDWKLFDRMRRGRSAVHVDTIEAYQQGKLSRRSFIRRGTIIGLSMPTMAAVISACGGDDDDAGSESAESTAEATGGESTAEATAESTAEAPSAGGELTVGIQQGDATSGLDPLNMLDLGTYCVVTQSFEYLVGLADDGGIGPTALATEWTPNDDASQWTFQLRDGVMWQDGTPFTSADVAATLDRMAEANAGVGGAWVVGSTETPDDLTVVMNLENPNGNLPVLVSIYNAQSPITPVDYASGTTLDESPNGTGAWVLDSFDPTTFTSTFVPNPNWWGGAVNLDRITLQGFDSGGTKVAAMASGEIDVIQDFTVTDGSNLLERRQRHRVRPPSANHRKIWFDTQLPEGWAVHRPRRAPGSGVRRRPPADRRHRVPGRGDHRERPCRLRLFPSFDPSQEQRPSTSRWRCSWEEVNDGNNS